MRRVLLTVLILALPVVASIVVYFIWVTGLYLLSRDLGLRVFVVMFCGAVFFVLTRTIFRLSIEVSETEAYRRLAKGLRNPRRFRDVQLRIAFLTLSVVLSYPSWFAYITVGLRFVVLTEALIILTTVVLYVLACDPLPPCAGKVREWLRAMAPARNANAPTSVSCEGSRISKSRWPRLRLTLVFPARIRGCRRSAGGE